MRVKSKHYHITAIVLFAILCVFLTFNRHSKTAYFDYQSELWADKAGYYVYLPALFNYCFSPENFSDSLDKMTGEGFFLDYDNSKVVTKYTYGVALLQLPFYLVAETINMFAGKSPAGFAPVHHKIINIAAIFYLLAGLLFLGKYLARRYNYTVVYISLAFIFAATNLFYYAIDETAMSHVYSFAAFAAFIFYVSRNNFMANTSIEKNFVFGALCALIIILRPTNIIFLSVFFFLDVSSTKDVVARFRSLLNLRLFLPALTGVILVFLPQMLYWNYTHGSMVFYSYGEEGFNWTNPEFILSWFSPMNGLFIYTPAFALLLISSVVMAGKEKFFSVYTLVLFFLISYVFSSWWAWHFGCGFGGRNFVEYLAVFSIPLAFTINSVMKKSVWIKAGMTVLLLLFVTHNLMLTYAYDECYFGGIWEWAYYLRYFK